MVRRVGCGEVGSDVPSALPPTTTKEAFSTSHPLARTKEGSGESQEVAHLSEVGSVSLAGGLSSGDLVGSSGAGGSLERDVRSGGGNLVGLGVGLDLGDGDTSLGVGVDVDHLGVGETGVLVRVLVEQVALWCQHTPGLIIHLSWEPQQRP